MSELTPEQKIAELEATVAQLREETLLKPRDVKKRRLAQMKDAADITETGVSLLGGIASILSGRKAGKRSKLSMAIQAGTLASVLGVGGYGAYQVGRLATAEEAKIEKAAERKPARITLE